jgi:hypothetical protein
MLDRLVQFVKQSPTTESFSKLYLDIPRCSYWPDSYLITAIPDKTHKKIITRYKKAGKEVKKVIEPLVLDVFNNKTGSYTSYGITNTEKGVDGLEAVVYSEDLFRIALNEINDKKMEQAIKNIRTKRRIYRYTGAIPTMNFYPRVDSEGNLTYDATPLDFYDRNWGLPDGFKYLTSSISPNVWNEKKGTLREEINIIDNHLIR